MKTPVLLMPSRFLSSISSFKLPTLALAAATLLTVGTQSSKAVVIADSVTEFSGVQGQDNWYYQNWYQPLGFINSMVFDSGTNQWIDSNGRIFENGSHPHSTDWRISQVWLSEVSGPITITGSVSLLSPEAAGVTFQILTNYTLNNLAYSQSLAATDTYNFNITFDVSAGDSVLFSVIGNGGISNDNTIWNAQISTVPEPMTIPLALAGVGIVVLLRRFKRTNVTA